jgi:uncharacterized protein
MLQLNKNLRVDLKNDRLSEFCQKWNVVEMAFFGSVLRSDFRPDSDLDVLVTFGSQSNWSLLDFVRMERELSELCDRPIDLVEKAAIEASPNWIRRKEILSTAQVIYAA